MNDDPFFLKVEEVLKELVEISKQLLDGVTENLPAVERQKLEKKQDGILQKLNKLTTEKEHQFTHEELKLIQKHLTSFQSFNQAYIDILAKEAKILDLEK